MNNEPTAHPHAIGPYRIVEPLGEGGMAVVYLAEQTEPVERRIALKIIKPGMDSQQVVARFESERQALAVLDHPNIAKIFDGGISDSGQPYFVMEYIEGTPITEFCDANRMDTAARLLLFADVCRAVQHAHLKGLIHRDLKPSNILVGHVDGRPQPRIIDFGIAKAIDTTVGHSAPETRIGQIIGTPHYMSPEQTGMDVDIDSRTDIYSLGVVLYEMLVGALPLDLSTVRDIALPSVIREKIPPKPSARYTSLGSTRDEIAGARATTSLELARKLKGDLDWIVMKAIEKDRERRYETANALAVDCERFLDHQPVSARPPSTAYVLSRFARRNRAIVIAVVVANLAIILGSIVATLGYLRAAEAESAARQDAETANRISEFLVGLFEISDPSESRGNSVTAREVLDTAVDRVDDELIYEPEVRSRLLFTMAEVYGNLGLYRDSLPIAETAVDLRRQDSPNSVLLADSLDQLGAIKTNLGDPATAAELHRESQKIRETLDLQTTSGYVLNLQHQAITAYMQSDFELAGQVMTRALQKAESLDESNAELIADITGNLGVIHDQLGDLESAERYKRRAVESFDQLYGPVHPTAATARNNLALTLNRLQQPAAAAVVYREALSAYRQLYSDEHPNTANAMNNLAQVLVNLGQVEEAENLQRESLLMFEAIFGPEHSQVGTAAVNLGRILTANGKVTEAEELLRRALVMQTKLHPENHLRIFLAKEALAATLNTGSNFDEALQLATSAHDHFKKRYGAEHWRSARASSIIAESLIGLDDIGRAEPLLTEALPRVVAGLGEAHPASIAVMRSLVALYEATGQFQLAEDYRVRIQAVRP